jgi:hypothetical protein
MSLKRSGVQYEEERTRRPENNIEAHQKEFEKHMKISSQY